MLQTDGRTQFKQILIRWEVLISVQHCWNETKFETLLGKDRQVNLKWVHEIRNSNVEAYVKGVDHMEKMGRS